MYEETEQPLILCRKKVGESAEWLVGTGYADAMCKCVTSCREERAAERKVTIAAPGLRADRYERARPVVEMPSADLVGHIDEGEETILRRIQREGREVLAAGSIRLFDPDTALKAENALPPGRVAIEFWTGQGLTPGRLFVRQSSAWAKIFGHIVAMSEHARRRAPELREGMRIVFERCAADMSLEFPVASGGTQILARFPVLHVDDIAAYEVVESSLE